MKRIAGTTEGTGIKVFEFLHFSAPLFFSFPRRSVPSLVVVHGRFPRHRPGAAAIRHRLN
jgi:hypothetical protein